MGEELARANIGEECPRCVIRTLVHAGEGAHSIYRNLVPARFAEEFGANDLPP